VSAIKDRLLAAMHRDEALLYDVYQALLGCLFCGPWVRMIDPLGQITGQLAREDHTGAIRALITPPTTPNSFGPEGMYSWRVCSTDDIVGTADSLDEAQSVVDEHLRASGWVLVPASHWVSQNTFHFEIPPNETESANPFQVLADMYDPSKSISA
jgi:hypothetical protein